MALPPVPTATAGSRGRAAARRRRRVVQLVALAIAALLLVGYAHAQVSGVVDPGRALGVLTGDATAVVPGLGDVALPVAPGEGSAGHGGTEAAVGTPEGTAVAPGPDGVVGSDDDVLVSTGVTRGSSSVGGGSATTVTTGGPTSTSTTVPPIPTDLAIGSVGVPATAADSTDGCGKTVDFAAAQAADDQAETAWRMDGDGTGQSLTLSLGGSHRIVSVGMIPGYALVDPCDGTNRFTQNRRITRATWQFDDGTLVTQDLRDAAEMQMVAVSAQATTVTVHIDGVTADPERDFTAISELDVRGT